MPLTEDLAVPLTDDLEMLRNPVSPTQIWTFAPSRSVCQALKPGPPESDAKLLQPSGEDCRLDRGQEGLVEPHRVE